MTESKSNAFEVFSADIKTAMIRHHGAVRHQAGQTNGWAGSIRSGKDPT